MLLQHNAIQEYLELKKENEEDFFSLLELQKKSLALCLNAIAQLPPGHTIILVNEDSKKKRTIKTKGYEILGIEQVAYNKKDIYHLLAICNARFDLLKNKIICFSNETKEIINDLVLLFY